MVDVSVVLSQQPDACFPRQKGESCGETIPTNESRKKRVSRITVHAKA